MGEGKRFRLGRSLEEKAGTTNMHWDNQYAKGAAGKNCEGTKEKCFTEREMREVDTPSTNHGQIYASAQKQLGRAHTVGMS